MNSQRGYGARAALLLGVAVLALSGCGGSPSAGGVGTPVAGTFIDAPVQGLGYKAASWTEGGPARSWNSIASSDDGKNLAAVAYSGLIYTSTDSGASWTARASHQPWRSIASSSDGNKLAAVTYGSQIYTSINGGVDWIARENNRQWYAIASSRDGNKLAAVVYGGQIYTSPDGGVSWAASASTPSLSWRSIASSNDGKKLAAVAYNGHIYTSPDGGVSWTGGASREDWQSIASSSNGEKLAAVADNGQIHTSADSGVSWIARGESFRRWQSIASSSDGSKLAAVANGGQVYTSTDSGASWTARASTREWFSIASSSDGRKLAAGTLSKGIFTYAENSTQLTNAEGKYACTTGQDVTFYLGEQALGAVKCGEAVHVYHMAGAGESVEKGVRVARLLQSLNTSSDPNKIVLPDLTGITVNVRLDNDTDFDTDVRALMAALAGKGLLNSSPVTRAAAVAHVQTELNKLSDTQKTSLCSVNNCNSELLAKLLNPAGVKVSVTGLTTGKALDLQLLAGGSTQALKLLGTTGTTLSASFATVPTSGQSYTLARTDTDGSVSCTLTGNVTGTYDPLNAPTVTVSCSINTPVTTTLGGRVTGVGGGQSVTLKNGSETLTVSASGNYQFPTAIAAGSEYAVAVTATSPSNLKCTVGNGNGVAPVNVYSLATSVVSNIAVSCQVAGYSVGGTVLGLPSTEALGLVLASSDSAADKRVVRVTGSGAGTAYTFTNVTVAAGNTISLALDGSAPVGYTCMVSPTYTTPTLVNANVTDAHVLCSSSGGGGGGGGGGGTATVTAIAPSGSVVAGTSPSLFTVSGTNLPLTAILVLDVAECTSSSPSATGFTASCTTPAAAGSVTAQVKSDTAANSGVAIGTAMVVAVQAPGGGGGGGGGGSCGAVQTLPGSLNGTITGLSASGLSTITLTSPTTGSTVATVNYSSGCTSQVFTFDTLLGGGTLYGVQATAAGYTCTVTRGSGTMGASPTYVSDVTVSCL